MIRHARGCAWHVTLTMRRGCAETHALAIADYEGLKMLGARFGEGHVLRITHYV